MADLFDNPLATDGFEFVEYTARDTGPLEDLFQRLGFTAVAKHKSKDVIRYKQGDINFIVNREREGQPGSFLEPRQAGANAMAFRVKNAEEAFAKALERGAKPAQNTRGPGELEIPCIEGIGGAHVYFVDKYGAETIYDTDFEPIEGAREEKNSAGLTYLDHLTHNLLRGNMDQWADYYERIFNFREIRYFDIEGKVTGLISKAMTSPCGKIRIPLNESRDDQSQIEEFLKDYGGEGIQHIALGTDDIYETVELLRSRGVEFQDTPETYYEQIEGRLGEHGEDLERMRKNRILIDGAPSDDQGLLLQIFTTNAIGPIFFEIIQRKGNEGFGEGNFKALFESIELDQIRRGVVKDNASA
ncbi:MAG: 4-hydroxyphenylpyruvate dioxygenase [Parvularcula sp.]|nr:4-hydroxyphenylpyruvate dioxygenase [Parvularcula sp.]